ncbi:MAG: putative toxin-antitoxin system toxin component, PIN family [Microcystaceae cyanobacterium]
MVDTNVLVSSILIRKSSSDAALKKARSLGKLLFSEATFQELQTVLNRSKFDKYVSLTIRSEFMFRLKLESELIEIIEQVNLCRDLKDNQFLEVAMNGNADYLITGDQDLLVLRPFQEIQIMTVHEFLSEQ